MKFPNPLAAFMVFFVLMSTSIFADVPQEISIVLESANNGPFEIANSADGRVSGLHIDMVEAVAKKINVRIKWIPRPWVRAIESVKIGDVDGITYVTDNDERKTYMIFLPDNVLHEDKICVIVRKDFKENKFDGTLESLYGEKIGIATQYMISRQILENKSKFKLFEQTVKGEQLNEMLAAGHFDYTFSGPRSFQSRQDSASHPKLKMLQPCISGEKRYIAFASKRPGTQELAQKFDAAFKTWKKTPEYKKLLTKYEVTP